MLPDFDYLFAGTIFLAGRAVEGYTTTLIVLLLIGSAIMLSLGIIGYYITKSIRRSKSASTLYHFPDSSWKRGCLSGGKP